MSWTRSYRVHGARNEPASAGALQTGIHMIKLFNRKILIGVLFAGICLMGIVSLRNLPLELYPDTELPMLLIRVASRIDVDPSYMENSAVIPLEGAAALLDRVESILSYSEPKRGTIYVYFDKDVNVKYAFLKLQQQVALVKADSQIPPQFTVTVDKVNTESAVNQFMTLQVRGGGGVDRLRNIADQQIAPALSDVDGVASAQVFGGRSKTVEIVMDDDACRAAGITPSRIQNLLARNNNAREYAGAIREGGRRFFVNVDAEFRKLSDIEDIMVSNRNGKVFLKDIAKVFYGVKEPTTLSRVNGKDAVTVQLVRDAQANMIDLSHAVQAAVARLNRTLAPQDVQIVVQANTADDIEQGLNQIAMLAVIGCLLAVWVLWVFLRNLRLTLIVAAAIPVSVLGAFNLFYITGITLNSLTLVGMALAVGMLVDSSVVVMENIYRLAGRGLEAERAVVRGTAEVFRPVLASTLTTAIVFVPFLFASDFTIRLIGKHVGVSVIATLFIALLTAFLLVPTAVLLGLRRHRQGFTFRKVGFHTPAVRFYRVLLKGALRHPVPTVCGATAVFLASLGVCLLQGGEAAPQAQANQFSLYLTMPAGATLDKTDFAVRELEKRLQGIAEARDLLSMVYEDEAVLTIKLRDDFGGVAGRSLAQVKSDIQKRLDNFQLGSVGFSQPASSSRYRGAPGGAVSAARMQLLMGGGQDETVTVRGDDFSQMEAVADNIRYELQNLPSVQSVQLDIPGRQGEVHLLFDARLMRQYGIGLQSVASELSGFTQEMASGLTFKQGADQYDIMVTSKAASVQQQAGASAGRKDAAGDTKTLDELSNVPIAASDGTDHLLNEVSQIIRASGPASINRANQEHRIQITYRFTDDIAASRELLRASRQEVDNILAAMTFPNGLSVESVHGQSGLSDFVYLIGAAVLLIFMILAAVFESLTAPLVMMLSIPLAAIGAFWLLSATGRNLLNANSLMGFLILLGVVVGNGIILIDFVRVLRGRGFSTARALITAGQDRIRPIIITAITTAAGMLPLALGNAGTLGSIGAPFALTVIGGIISAALFTLVFLPTCYLGLESSLAYLRGLSWKVNAVQLSGFALAAVLIFLNVDNPVWRLCDLVIAAAAIPAAVWFVRSSLRRAAPAGKGAEPVSITIRNVQKLYGMPGRFSREWGDAVDAVSREPGAADWGGLLWQAPLLAFLVYFVYWYLESELWQAVFAVVAYGYLLFFVKKFGVFRLCRRLWKGFGADAELRILEAIRWSIPGANLVFFQFRWNRLHVVAAAGFVWYTALAVLATARWLDGRPDFRAGQWPKPWGGLAAAYCAFVKNLPLPGRRRPTFHALKGVSLHIEPGMYGLLGPNGAGKSTLMRIVAGVYDQTYGKVYINGRDTARHREELQGLIGYLPQEFGSYPNLTAWEFLDYQAILKGLHDPTLRKDRIGQVLSEVHMTEHARGTIGSFSGGMRQRIGIAQILLHLPRILIVDEPTAGLDPGERIRFRNLLAELGRDRIVIFSTHVIEDISSSCNRLAVLMSGELRYEGTPADMLGRAAGRVWQATIDAGEYDSFAASAAVVHRIGDRGRIQVRCIADAIPHPQALPAPPTLEDAYLCLMREKRKKEA